MEDVLDTFLVRVDKGESADPSGLKRIMKKTSKVFSKAKTRRDIADAVEDIKKHLEEIAQRRLSYKLDENMSKPVTETSTVDPRLPAMYKEVEELIGVDKSRDELISMLDPPHQLDDDALDKKITKKVSIVGVGGLGKTTLSRAVYEKLKSKYECGAFVSVGRDYTLEKVFKDILFQLDEHEYQNIHNTGRGVNLLIGELRKFLQNKRYFIVVDDVWKVDTWKTIQLALVENNCGSKIITTTRNYEVAKEADEVHKLKPLCNNESMKLFYTRIFGAEGKELDYQEDEVSIKILKKCAGIPLAIITMASLLVSKPMFEWSDVLNSISFGCKDDKEAENTMKILSLSYYDLPPHLRTCLLYLSTYPEDYLIKKDPLIWKWIAEGFIDGKQGTILFELGQRYFNDLINRSLIQAVENGWDGRVEGCRVHDMVLDLIRDLSFEENFIALLGDNVDGIPVPSSARRLVDQNRKVELINSKTTGTHGIPKVRSYTAVMCFINNPAHFLRFELLRVLDIVRCSFGEGVHLEHLGDLLHLRYLQIRVLELPKQIGNLKLLQTLDVSGILPGSIILLTELRRLCAHGNVPYGTIGRMVSLEELVLYGRSDKLERFLKELGSLREQRVLEFSTYGMGESMQRDFMESLSNLQKICHIRVYGSSWEADTAMWEAGRFVLSRPLRYLEWSLIRLSKLPSCINPSRLPNLSHLTLSVASMDEQDLRRLARLPSLTYLHLATWSILTTSNIN